MITEENFLSAVCRDIQKQINEANAPSPAEREPGPAGADPRFEIMKRLLSEDDYAVLPRGLDDLGLRWRFRNQRLALFYGFMRSLRRKINRECEARRRKSDASAEMDMGAELIEGLVVSGIFAGLHVAAISYALRIPCACAIANQVIFAAEFNLSRANRESVTT